MTNNAHYTPSLKTHLIGYFTDMKNRYFNCQYWHANVIHSVFHAIFNPSHANKNLYPEDY